MFISIMPDGIVICVLDVMKSVCVCVGGGHTWTRHTNQQILSANKLRKIG